MSGEEGQIVVVGPLVSDNHGILTLKKTIVRFSNRKGGEDKQHEMLDCEQ